MTMDDQSSGRPKIALLGEFSAGKSTLLNGLLEQERSPMRVTATHVPPLWYTHGEGKAVRVTKDGSEFELEGDDLSAVPLEGTQYVRVFVTADILERCDLIDMPGSSDPNMSPEIWDAMLPRADGVIWCTPSTQAWRQSEAAIWEEVPEKLYDHSILLLTRIDKVRKAEDRARLHSRVSREVAGKFRGVFPVALLQALESKDDPEMWRNSGMAAFTDALNEITKEFASGGKKGGALSAMPQREAATAAVSDDTGSNTAAEDPGRSENPSDDQQASPEPEKTSGPAVVPRRVTRLGNRSARTRRSGSNEHLL